MLIKTILNRIEKFKSFVYGECCFEEIDNTPSLIVDVAARKNAKGLCPECHESSPSYDKQPLRRYQYVPLWNIPVYFELLSILVYEQNIIKRPSSPIVQQPALRLQT